MEWNQMVKSRWCLVFSVFLVLGVGLLSCDLPLDGGGGGDSDGIGSSGGMTMKKLLESGFYIIYAEEDSSSFYTEYTQTILEDGKVVDNDYDWDNGKNQWVRVSDIKSDEEYIYEDYIYEEMNMLYMDDNWTEWVESGLENWAPNYNSSGNLMIPWEDGPMVVGIGQTKDLSDVVITAFYPSLAPAVPNGTKFITGSFAYTITTKFMKEFYSFWIKDRECKKTEAVKGRDDKYSCPNETWQNIAKMENTTLSGFRERYSSKDRMTDTDIFRYYFEPGTDKVILYQYYSPAERKYLKPPVLFNEKGSWTEKEVNGRKIMEVHVPSVQGQIKNGRNAFLEMEGNIYRGIYIPMGTVEVKDDEFILNEAAMSSILEVFQPPAGLSKLKTLAKPGIMRNTLKKILKKED